MGNAASTTYPPHRPRPPRRRSPSRRPASASAFGVHEINPPKVEGDLKFERIDVMTKENRMKHQTDSYSNKSLIVRRGEAFDLKLYLSDKFNEDTDTIILHFTTGDKPSISKGSRVQLSSRKDSDWKLELRDIGKEELIMSVTPESRTAVGSYSLMVETRREKSDDTKQASRRKVKETIIILFNPFCPGKEDDKWVSRLLDDDVYMKEEAERREYVLDDQGIIHRGSWIPRTYMTYRSNWIYGQFEPDVLDCALLLLEISPLMKTPRSLGNIVQVLRTLSAGVNSNDDNGIISGNWSGEYAGGTAPYKWVGSVKIIQEYMKNRTSVKYGQCWVYAGVLTTVCRALGIPTRPVTNIGSAHDTDGSCTIDTYIDHNGDSMESGDSVWNFHVWNEAWCQRPDLPEQYSGSAWQAFDSTPQERSDSKFQCGPCPVAAIRNGDLYIPNDGKFIFAEVNADRIWWRRNEDGEMNIDKIETDTVGEGLATKKVGENKFEIVTNQYKPTEQTADERMVVMNAVRGAVSNETHFERWKEVYKKDKEETLDINLSGEIDGNYNCKFYLNVTNMGDETRTFVVNMTITAKYIDGRIGEQLAKFGKELVIEVGQAQKAEWILPAEQYFCKMDDDARIFLWAKTKVVGTGEIMTRSGYFEAPKPELEIKVSKKVVRVNEVFEVTIEFTNPVSVTLTECEMDMECLGIENPKAIRIPKQLDASGKVSQTLNLTAIYPGKNMAIIASFDSKELRGITGMATIEIEE